MLALERLNGQEQHPVYTLPLIDTKLGGRLEVNDLSQWIVGKKLISRRKVGLLQPRHSDISTYTPRKLQPYSTHERNKMSISTDNR